MPIDSQYIIERAGTVPFVRQITPWENNAQGNVQHERNINMKALTGLVVALLVCAMAGFGALGCNTVKGAGKDIQKGGQAVEKAAIDAENGKQQPTITASAEPGGSISPSGCTRVSCRSSRTFTIKANRGYHVADVLVDGTSVGARSRYTFDNVTVNRTITAVFTANPHR